MSSLLYNVSEIKQFMKHAGVERIMFSSVKNMYIMVFFYLHTAISKKRCREKSKKSV